MKSNNLPFYDAENLIWARAILHNKIRYFHGRLRLWWAVDLLNIPTSPCCYTVFLEGRLIYIGSTQNLYTRFSKHFVLHPEWRGTVTIKARFPKRYGEWIMTERRLIRRLQPELNKAGIRESLRKYWKSGHPRRIAA